ncbi:P-loop NTPase fold protein [Clostridium sp. JS66]|uniref:KAP family P-loop NTPase fold protein n=1 Tax=Clostridium sp. JS66 TaxID=3064705 RepID=UPI00298DBFA1|nr:P-loop NTPase fold protein [Clostridium sp. JS66]WPC42846.1 P-loop NTPase fold protein [Clostridium sp. JS66]
MWIDNASKIDMLAYKPYAELIYGIVNNKRMNPLTVGLFGSWGSGKSTLIKLIEEKIKPLNVKNKIICINLNAWMFEGYDEAKTALMESLLRAIKDNDDVISKCEEEVVKLIKRVDWIRLAGNSIKKGVPLALSLASGNPLPFVFNISSDLLNKLGEGNEVEKLVDSAKKLKKDYIKDEKKESFIENIRSFRKEFSKMLVKADINNLIVMIDDLDRCTPDRIIDTLEAIKLFLSVERTTFIIAVDERIITYSVKQKYPSLDDDTTDISKDYIEKIIQLPIKIPELSELEIKNYMILLVTELYFNEKSLNSLLEKLYNDNFFIQGEMLNLTLIQRKSNLSKEKAKDILEDENKLDDYNMMIGIIEQIGDTIAGILKGNPRQAKRFLNTFLVRKNMAEIQKIKLDLNILAKLMVLEYIDVELFNELYKWQEVSKGEIIQIKELQEYVSKEEELPQKYGKWDNPRIRKWIMTLPINFYQENLKPYFYLSRESLGDNISIVTALNKLERDKLQNILKASKPKQREEIRTLLSLPKDSSDKIIKVLIQMYKNKRVVLHLLTIVYEEFKEFRYEILDEIKNLTKKEITMPIIHELKSLYDIDNGLMIEVLEYMMKNGIINDKVFKLIKEGGKK